MLPYIFLALCFTFYIIVVNKHTNKAKLILKSLKGFLSIKTWVLRYVFHSCGMMFTGLNKLNEVKEFLGIRSE